MIDSNIISIDDSDINDNNVHELTEDGEELSESTREPLGTIGEENRT